jgi:hypothetical protein
LFELNLKLLQFYLRCLRLPIPVEFTAEYYPSYPTLSVLDRRDWLTPKAPALPLPDTTSGLVGPRPYLQTFGKDFVPGLSILDLLFMQGPAAGSFLT